MKHRLLAFLQTPGGAFLCAMFVTYFPFSWILVMSDSREEWEFWPRLPGIVVAELLGALFSGGPPRHWFQWSELLLSIALPCVVFLLLLQFKSRRLLITFLAMGFFCALSFLGWILFRS